MGTTDDPTDPRLGHGIDPDGGHEQNDVHLVLPIDERRKVTTRPIRHIYLHIKCGGATTMSTAIAETYATSPSFYGSTFCCHCSGYFKVGADGEFEWEDGSKVGT